MVRRRVLFQSLGALAAGAAGSSAALEAIRTGLASALTGEEPQDLDVDEWAEVAWEYGRSYGTASPDALVGDLAADLADVQQRLDHERDDLRRADLTGVIAQLSGVLALSLSNLDQTRAARRWWRTARQAADASGIQPIQVWVRSCEGMRALYQQRPERTLALSEKALALGGPQYAADPLAGKAQALAALGRDGEARATVGAVAQALSRMPASVSDDKETVYGWPVGPSHTESWVYAHLGDTAKAEKAASEALALYPAARLRQRALIQIHQAICMTRAGDCQTGATHAHAVIEGLPATQRTANVRDMAQTVLQAVPAAESARAPARELRELLAAP